MVANLRVKMHDTVLIEPNFHEGERHLAPQRAKGGRLSSKLTSKQVANTS